MSDLKRIADALEKLVGLIENDGFSGLNITIAKADINVEVPNIVNPSSAFPWPVTIV